jgi:hypothetical protein
MRSEDRISAEGYYQQAEHYYRVAMRAVRVSVRTASAETGNARGANLQTATAARRSQRKPHCQSIAPASRRPSRATARRLFIPPPGVAFPVNSPDRRLARVL